MSNIPRLLQAFFLDDDGATAIEYALIAVMISLAIIVGATSLGQALQPAFQTPTAAMTP